MPGPTYEAKATPQVQPGVDIPLSVTPQQLGAGVGEAIQNLGDVAEDIHLKEVQHANTVAVTDADNQQQAFINQRLYDPKQGVLNQPLGKDAPSAVDKTLADFDEHTSQVSAGLTNEAQKSAFRNAVQARRFDLERQLGDYEHKETERYADQVTQGSIENSGTAAVQSADRGDYEGAFDRIMEQQAVIAQAGRRKKMAPELIEAQQKDVTSKTHLGVIGQLVSTGQDTQAKTWFDHVHGDLTKEDLLAATHLVKAGTLAGESQRIADEFLYDQDGNVADRASVLKKIHGDKRLADNQQLREGVETRTDKALAEHAQATDEAERTEYTAAYNLLNDPNNAQGIYHPAIVAKMATMSPERQQALKNYAAKDGKVQTDVHTWLALNNVLSDPSRRSEANAIHLEDYVDRLDKGDLESFSKRIADIKAGKNEVQNSDAVVADVVKDTMRINKIDPGKPGTALAADAANLERTVRQDCDAAAKEKGAPLTRDEVQKIADQNVLPKVTGTKWFGMRDDVQPLYKARASVRTASPTPDPDLATKWRQSLAQPHSEVFDGNIATLQQWSQGIDRFGFPDPNLKAQATAIIQNAIPGTVRTQMVAAWGKRHQGERPTDAQLLGMWADYQKDTVPPPAAPIVAPGSDYFLDRDPTIYKGD